jgi:hypothetical protein
VILSGSSWEGGSYWSKSGLCTFVNEEDAKNSVETLTGWEVKVINILLYTHVFL